MVGIDVESLLVESPRSLIARRSLADRISFQLVDPGPLPLADGSFDVVFSKDAIVHIPDKAALYREVLRVLRPGGRFLASARQTVLDRGDLRPCHIKGRKPG